MKSFDTTGWYKPFEQLKSLLERQSISLKKTYRKNIQKSAPNQTLVPPIKSKSCPKIQQNEMTVSSNLTDEQLFMEAMADVTPLARDNCIDVIPGIRFSENTYVNPNDDSMIRLQNLIRHGEGFIVSQTPEYMEGRGRSVHPDIVRRLHRGDYAIQAHIDLHGYHVPEAEEALNKFLSAAIMSGKRSVLIIHGRGLSSPGIPVIKNLVYQWLTTGPWRKWIIAFSSARPCDGGAGATYALLRRHPDRKQKRKKWKISH